jgi:hypothetical protein
MTPECALIIMSVYGLIAIGSILLLNTVAYLAPKVARFLTHAH